MIVTEEEAKTKWCPFSRNEHMGGANRQHGGGGGIGCCIASGCMAWRKVGTIVDRATGDPIPPGTTYLRDSAEERYLGRGYCGLAG